MILAKFFDYKEFLDFIFRRDVYASLKPIQIINSGSSELCYWVEYEYKEA